MPRWETLFADLAAQGDALEQAERDGEVDDRTRREVAAGSLIDRLRASPGERVRLACAGALYVEGLLSQVGPDWLLVDEGAGRDALVSLSALMSVRGLSRHSENARTVVASKVGLRSALRGIARDRSEVRAHLRNGTQICATVDRVGQDYIEVAVHRSGEARRSRDVLGREAIAFAALSAIRRLA